MRKYLAFAVTLALIKAMPQPDEHRPSFEVASVKRSQGDRFPDFAPRRSGDRVTMHNVRLASVVIYAYHLEHGRATTSYELAGKVELPDAWDIYDIDAIAPGPPADEQLRAMFQTLLETRFQLRFHRETRQLPLYSLEIAKGGPKLKASDPSRTEKESSKEVGVSRVGGKGASIEQLIEILSARLDAPIRNATGLQGGKYDFDFRYAAGGNLSVQTSVPDLMGAVREELGLNLRPARGPVSVMVVDQVKKPTEN